MGAAEPGKSWPHPGETGSLLQVAMATSALGLPDLDSSAFVYLPFPMHQRLTPAAQAAPPSLYVEISSWTCI